MVYRKSNDRWTHDMSWYVTAISKCEAHRIGPAESLIIYTRVFWLSMQVFYWVMHVTCFCRCEDYASCRLIDSCRIANAFNQRRVVLVLGVAWTCFHWSLQPFSNTQVTSETYGFIHLFHLFTCSRWNSSWPRSKALGNLPCAGSFAPLAC